MNHAGTPTPSALQYNELKKLEDALVAAGVKHRESLEQFEAFTTETLAKMAELRGQLNASVAPVESKVDVPQGARNEMAARLRRLGALQDRAQELRFDIVTLKRMLTPGMGRGKDTYFILRALNSSELKLLDTERDIAALQREFDGVPA